MRSYRFVVGGLLALILAACQPASPRAGEPSSPQRTEQTRAPKVVTVAVSAKIASIGPLTAGTTGGGARQLAELHSEGLTTTDNDGNLVGRLATEVPSMAAGTVELTPDGKMKVTWKIRPNVKWHDGAPFTGEDVKLGWQVARDPAMPAGSASATAALSRIEQIDLPDPLTVVMTWKAPYFKALNMTIGNIWPLPKHLLIDAYEAGDAQAFLNSPYWTTEYVHVGPFKLVEFGLGEDQVYERFDGFFLGTPKLDRVNVKVIGDPNSMFANVLAGTVDIAGDGALPIDLIMQLRDEWAKSGEGAVVTKPGNWRFVHVQFNPDYAKIPELRTDSRLRQGLFRAMDRAALREAMAPGLPNTDADGFMPAGDPRTEIAGKPWARFPYDQAAALRDLADGGWRKGADGRILNSAGERVQLPLRTLANGTRDTAIIAQGWRDLGFDVNEEVTQGSQVQDRAYRVAFPGLESSAQGNGDGVLNRFDGRNCPRPPTYAGSPGGCYSNPAFDQLLDRLYATLDLQPQALLLKEVGEFLAQEMPVMPTSYAPDGAATRKGVRALTDDYVGSAVATSGFWTRNAHLWDRE